MSYAGGRRLSRRRAALEIAALALGAVPLMGRASRAQDVPKVMMVEEDWALVIGVPDAENHAPGVKMIMSTQEDLLGYSADFCINHRKVGSPPEFAAGGYGIEVCRPGQALPVIEAGSSGKKLAIDGETLTWTQRLKLADGTLTFSIQESSSTTWGTTTGEVLSVSSDCSIDDLEGYLPSFSVAQSGPVWWPSRVTALTMTGVRYFGPTGILIRTDLTPRVAHP